MKNWIGISLGDVTGVGPEVALKAIAAEAPADETKYLLIGDEHCLRQLNSSPDLNLPLEKFSGYGAAGRFFVFNPHAEPLPEKLPAGSPLAAHAAIAALHDGGQPSLRGELDAFVTPPANKESIVRPGHKFAFLPDVVSDFA